MNGEKHTNGAMSSGSDKAGNEPTDFEVIIIGAGAAGIGMAMTLKCAYMKTSKLLVLEQGPSIGTSFRQWHKHTRFISPSWPGAAYGVQDLNAVFPDTKIDSAQHPTGDEYADYLEAAASQHKMNIKFNHKVTRIEESQDEPGHIVHVEGCEKPFTATCVIWCGGEWGSPASTTDVKGCSFDPDCSVHYKDYDFEETVKLANSDDSKNPVVVVGLGEAGVDTACALAARGVSVTVVDGNDPDAPKKKDPSCNLSPKSQTELSRYSDKINIIRGQKCVRVSSKGKGTTVEVQLADIHTDKVTQTLETACKVVLCIGFNVSQNEVIKDLFYWRDDGCPMLDKETDESTKVPNIFVAGPTLRHEIDDCNIDKDQSNCDTAVFCFIYKFRSRFAIVASEVINRVINQRYTEVEEDEDEDEDSEEKKEPQVGISREGQIWGLAVDGLRDFFKGKGMLLSEITSACGGCG